ncbi:MAG: FtsX-like permease family protein, partial [Bacteroidota bacterium]
YGATRWQLVWLVTLEGMLLSVIGFLLGVVFSRCGLWLITGWVQASYHYALSGWAWEAGEGWLLAAALGIGLFASLLPAFRVFHINLSQTLADA